MKNKLNKNKSLFFLPLVLLPFLILIFYILGGGKQQKKQQVIAQNKAGEAGVNYNLPEAEKSLEIHDKMQAYEKQEQLVPMGKENILRSQDSLGTKDLKETDSLLTLLKNGEGEDVAPQLLAHIRKKEELTRKEIFEESSPKEISTESFKTTTTVHAQKEIPFQEKHMNELPEEQKGGLSELEQIFEENISLNQANDSLKYYLRESQQELLAIKEKRKRSFSLQKEASIDFNGQKMSSSLIRAEIYESASVLDGNRIKLRLLEDVWLDGKKAIRNTFFYGICKIRGERLNILVSYFPLDNHFLPVKLEIHDLDGLPGLYVPDRVSRKVSKEVGSRTNASALWDRSNDPMSKLAISAADRSTQTLLKRVRLRKVRVQKNTMVYLINKN